MPSIRRTIGHLRPQVRPLWKGVVWPGGAAAVSVMSGVSVTISGTTLTIAATTSIDLTAAVFGVEYGIGRAAGYVFSKSAAGAAASQSISIGAAETIAANDVVNVRAYYNTDVLDGAGTRVYGPAIAPKAGARGAPTGTLKEEFTITVGNATEVAAAGASLMSISYQWQQDTANNGVFVDISSATSSTLALLAANVGNKVRCGVRETNSAGVSTVSYSTAATVVSAVGKILLNNGTDAIVLNDGTSYITLN